MKSIKRIWNSFKIAFSMYSRIPMPRSEWTDENKSYAMCFFPWIGAVIGLLSYGVFRFSKWFDGNGGGNYSLFFVIFLILIPVFITGGIHLDGFLETQDALSSWQTKERRLEILKDSHIGAFSVIMLAVFGLIYLAAFAQITDSRALVVFCCGFFLSRCLSGLSVVSFRSAKSDGMLYHFASTAHERRVKAALYVQLLACMGLMLYFSISAAVPVLAAALLVFAYYRWRSYKELGGITGDTAGWFLTVCEGAMAAAAAVASLM